MERRLYCFEEVDCDKVSAMKLAYFGYLPIEMEAMGGAEVKTKTVLKALRKESKIDKIKAFNTAGWKRHIVKLIFQLLYACFFFDSIIFVSAATTFNRILPYLLFFCKISKCEIHFIPVGDCEPKFFCTEKSKRRFSKIKGAYVQTELSYRKLKEIGFQNIYVMHNFKYVQSYSTDYDIGQGLRFVFFSRVSEVKGIFDTIRVFESLHEKGVNCFLDIYGKIDGEIEESFMRMIEKDKAFVKYKGVASPDESSSILKDYYMMVFPTKFSGEGFPGVILDAFAAGIPILSSHFRFYDDLLKDHYNSLVFDLDNFEDFEKKLIYACEHPDAICNMRSNSAAEYKKYSPEKEIGVLVDRL